MKKNTVSRDAMFNHVQKQHKGQLGASENAQNSENSQPSRYFESAWTKMMKKSQIDQTNEKSIKSNFNFGRFDKSNQFQADNRSDETVKDIKSVKMKKCGFRQERFIGQ